MTTNKIELSNSDKTFNYIGYSFNQYPEFLSFIINADEYSFEEVETAFKGNDEIRLVNYDESGEVTGESIFKNWTELRSVRKDYNYVIDTDTDGNEIIIAVYVIEVEKADVENRISGVETKATTNASDITDMQVAIAELYEAFS